MTDAEESFRGELDRLRGEGGLKAVGEADKLT